jgi:predicted MFS family arabinose efflux permease
MSKTSKIPPKANTILPIIVAAQFACTSLWFAGNAVSKDLVDLYQLGEGTLGHLTSAVQFGFISGTLVFALLGVSDRFSPSRVFMVCALLGATANLLVLLPDQGLTSLLLIRFATGFFLAGIYPVGMKIASDYHEKGLGKALGFLVGALVLGTAFPHLVKSIGEGLSWQVVFICTSAISALGGIFLFITVPDGPFRKASIKIDLRVSLDVFKKKDFRRAAFGYFGHMWELYAFWAFVPAMFARYQDSHSLPQLNISFLSFIVIGAGAFSCVTGGYISAARGSKLVAQMALTISGMCCILSPLGYKLPFALFIVFLLIWGASVVADSPQFSTLVAQSAPKENTGTALTIVNCLGFSITIASIEVVQWLMYHGSPNLALLALAPGPVLGVLATVRKDK